MLIPERIPDKQPLDQSLVLSNPGQVRFQQVMVSMEVERGLSQGAKQKHRKDDE